MKQSVIFIIALGLTLSLWGQNNDTIEQKTKEETSSDQDGFDELTLQLASQEQTIARLREDSVAMQANIARQKVKIEELVKEVAEANAAAEKSKKDFETLKQTVLSKDAVLYKQCLLYPLERRYNPALIADALATVNLFAGLGQTSDKFEEYSNTYQPLLNQYGLYNQQLVDFFQECIGYIEKREEKLGEGGQVSAPKKWLEELKGLPYYKECYVGKDAPPFKSIIYLDEVIDEFKVAIEKNDGLKSELQNLIKKLEPKKN